MTYLPAILALLTGIAGWFYLFYSRGARGLAGLEAGRLNRRRARLRRAGGAVMLLLATGFYLGFYAVDPGERPRMFVAVWLGVMGLLAVVVVLALMDIRLTGRLRRPPGQRSADPPRAGQRGSDLDPPPTQ